MAPPGRPNMTSTCCISKLLISACAPVSSIGGFLFVDGRLSVGTSAASEAGHENDLPSGRSESAHGERASCALRNEYQDDQLVCRADTHDHAIVARPAGGDKHAGRLA